MKRETGPPEIFVCFFLTIMVWKRFLCNDTDVGANANLKLTIDAGARRFSPTLTRGIYCTDNKFGPASERLPRRLPPNRGRIMTLLVQLALLIRNAAPPQFSAIRFVK